MKKITIGTIVATIIYFAFQSIMWMSGFHKDFYTYTPKQDTVMHVLAASLPAEGMYMMPMADPKSPDFRVQQDKLEKTMIGNPWTMIFYHPKMKDFSASYLLIGILYSLIAALIAAVVLYYTKFPLFCQRFFLSMAFVVFTLAQGVLGYTNWWSFPWSFIKPQVFDLVVGWILCSVWLAWFIKTKTQDV